MYIYIYSPRKEMTYFIYIMYNNLVYIIIILYIYDMQKNGLVYIYIYIYIPKTQKMVLDSSLLNTQHYKVRIKGKVEQYREGVAPSLTPWCSSYRKRSLRVTLDYGRQLYFTYIYIYIYIYIYPVSVQRQWVWIIHV